MHATKSTGAHPARIRPTIRPFTHADATATDEGLRHVKAFIRPELLEAAELSQRIKFLRGQSRIEGTRKLCRLLIEGLRDA